VPALFDLTWKPSASSSELPTDQYPYLGPAVYRGDGYSIHFILTEDAEAATPPPYEPEGTLTAQVRAARLDPGEEPDAPLAEFSVDVVANEVTIALTAEQTASLPISAYWDLQESFDDSEPRTWFTGKIKSWGDVTRENA
jgi:hypothetical protein